MTRCAAWSWRLLASIVVVGCAVQFVGAQRLWVVTYDGGGTSINEQQLAMNSLTRVTATYTSDTSLVINKPLGSVLPSTCISNAPGKWGFTKWQTTIINKWTVSGTKKVSIIFNIPMVEGFALKQDEKVTCGPLKNVTTQLPLYNGNIDDPGKFDIQFSKVSATSLTMWGINGGENGDTKAPDSQPSEKGIRLYGFELYLKLVADVWDDTRKSDIMKGFSCPLNCHLQLFNESDLVISAATPNRLSINLPRERTRTFNIGVRSTFTFTPTASMTYKGIVPSTAYNTFQIDAEATSPWIQFCDIASKVEIGTQVVVTEACVRGLQDCTRQLLISIASKDGSPTTWFQSTLLPEVTEELRGSFDSAGPFHAVRMNFYDSYDTKAISQTRKVYILWKAIRALDVCKNESVIFAAPFSIFNNLEPPVSDAPMTILVTPSPGTAKGDLHNIFEKDVWADSGTVEMNITMDGESWNPANTIAQFSSAVAVKAATVDGNINGWAVWGSEVLASAAFVFHSSVLTLRFQRSKLFDIDVVETVTFSISSSMTCSGLPLTSFTDASFTITPSIGLASTDSELVYEESAVWNGNVSLVLTLMGESWKSDEAMLKSCLATMVSAWASDVSSGSGWASSTVRSQLAVPSAFTRIDLRNVLFTPPGVPDYDTVAGEQIAIAVNAKCTRRDSDVALEFIGSKKLQIRPHPAVVTSYLLFANGLRVAANKATGALRTNEQKIRRGNFSLILVLSFDGFDLTVPDLPKKIFEAMIGTQEDATTWNNKKASIVFPSNISMPNKSCVVIPFTACAAFDVSSGSDIVTLQLDASWMLSRREPLNSVTMEIEMASGVITLRDWSGYHMRITEDTIRRGELNFTFLLLGDSWRRTREGIVQSIVVFNRSEHFRFGMNATYEEVVPDVEFFAYTYEEPYEVFVLQLQSAPTYDIAEDEVVGIRFANFSVVSWLSPAFEFDDVAVPMFTFTVHVSPGLLLLSGVVSGINEKMLRRGSITLFLSLFGETFAPSAVPLLLENINGDDPTSNTSFRSLKSFILPPNKIVSSNYYCTVSLVPDSRYNIDVEERITVALDSAMFSSNLLPSVRSILTLPVGLSGGELSFSFAEGSASTIDEATFRSTTLRIYLKLSGDTWRSDAIQLRPVSFLLGFSSGSSIVQEPSGLNANYANMLQLRNQSISARVRIVDDANTTVEVLLCGTCAGVNYDIANDEQITFSLLQNTLGDSPECIYTQTGRLPDPSSVSFTVVVTPRRIVVVIDNSALKSQFALASFVKWVAALLSCDVARIVATQPLVADIVVKMHFTNDDDSSSSTSGIFRSSTELSELLMSLNATYLRATIAAKVVYYEDNGPPSETQAPTTTVPPTAGAAEGIMDGASGRLIWFGIAVLFTASIGGIMWCYAEMRKGELGGSSRHSTDPSTHLRKQGHTAQDASYDAEDDEHGLVTTNPMLLYAGQRQPTVLPSSTRATSTRCKTLQLYVREQVEAKMKSERDQRELGLPARKVAKRPLPLNPVIGRQTHTAVDDAL